MNKLIKNNKGFSIAEIMVALGIVGVIGLGVAGLIKQTNNLKRESQDDSAIDQAFKDIQTVLTYSEQNDDCELSLGGVIPNSNIVARKLNGSIGPYSSGTEISPTVTIQRIRSEISPGFSITGKTQAFITVEFRQKMANGNHKTITKSFVRPIVRDASGSLSCKEFDESLVETESLQTVCNEVGGTVNGSTCEFDSTVIDPDLEERMKRFACSLFGDMNNYTSGLCNQIEVTQAAYGDNVSPAQVCINGSDCRNTFETSPCESGEFVTGVSKEGYRTCGPINFVGQGNACIPNCSCKWTTPVGQTCDDQCGGQCNGIQPVCSPVENCSCVSPSLSANSFCSGNDGCGTTIQCYGRNCDYMDSYSRAGDDCNFRNYSQGSSPGSSGCTNFTNTTLPTPECKEISGGSCSGSNPPSYTNVANGTSCGGGRTCQNGNCVDPYPCSTPSGSQTWGTMCSATVQSYDDSTGRAVYRDRNGPYQGDAVFLCQSNGSFALQSGWTCNGSGGGGGGTGGGGGLKGEDSTINDSK